MKLRVFNIDIETCTECGGSVKVIACIEDPVVIKKILTHLKEKAASKKSIQWPESRRRRRLACSTDTPLNSSGCDSDGSGRASNGLMTGVGVKVSVMKKDFSVRTPEFSKVQWRQRARYPCERLSNTIGF